MARALGRLVLVPLGLLLAIAAALGLLVMLGLERATNAVHAGDVDLTRWSQVLQLARGFLGLAMAATVVPAVLVIIIGEVAHIRSPIYYVVGGGAALTALPLFARAGSLGQDLSQIGLIWQVFATAGFTGGLVYWLVAGRKA